MLVFMSVMFLSVTSFHHIVFFGIFLNYVGSSVQHPLTTTVTNVAGYLVICNLSHSQRSLPKTWCDPEKLKTHFWANNLISTWRQWRMDDCWYFSEISTRWAFWVWGHQGCGSEGLAGKGRSHSTSSTSAPPTDSSKTFLLLLWNAVGSM